MALAYTIVPAAPVRASHSHKAEIVSQLLFGETADMLETQGEFVKIKCSYDGYEGWVQDRQLALHQAGPANSIVLPVPLTILCNSVQLHLSPGSMLPSEDTQWQVGPYQFSFNRAHADNAFLTVQTSAEGILKTAQQYLGTSYLWGGKSIFGLDCSGYTQQVFKIAGIRLPRDAWQQAEEGILVNALEEARPGDLAFFDNAAGRVNHVGILSSTRTIMHASANARHDAIDSRGIVHNELQEHTHNLKLIKRYL